MDVEYLEMCQALPKEVQNLIPDTIETRWCNGYHIYIYVKGHDEFGDERNTEYQIQHCEPPILVKKPFKVPRFGDLARIAVKHFGMKMAGVWYAYKLGSDYSDLFEITTLLEFIVESITKKEWDVENQRWVTK